MDMKAHTLPLDTFGIILNVHKDCFVVRAYSDNNNKNEKRPGSYISKFQSICRGPHSCPADDLFCRKLNPKCFCDDRQSENG